METARDSGTPVLACIGAAFGAASLALLGSAFVWAHHWGVLADSIVAAWSLATLGAFVVSIWSLATTDRARAFARVGVALALVSVLALIVVGSAFAAGYDMAGQCGGG